MSIVDERGRVAGRINLIDAVAAVAIVVLVPVAYAAYLLFRTPPAALRAVQPAKVYQGPNGRVAIEGENLRPFMRVSFNTIQGRTFLIGSTKLAQIDLPDLDPGTYDVVLFDYMREVSRLPKALTVLPFSPTPTIVMQVSGSFKQINDNLANLLRVGTQFPPTGGPLAEITSVAPRRAAQLRLRAGAETLRLPLPGELELPATLRLHCFTQSSPDGSIHCAMSGPQFPANVAPDSYLTLAGPTGWVSFQIDEVHVGSEPTMAVARVRFVATAEVLAKLKVGDIDTSTAGLAAKYQAAIVSVGTSRAIPGSEAGVLLPVGGNAHVVEAVVRVPIELAPGGPVYRERPLKAGESFQFETALYTVSGGVIDVTTQPVADPSFRQP
jgi:hypothetical protein